MACPTAGAPRQEPQQRREDHREPERRGQARERGAEQRLEHRRVVGDVRDAVVAVRLQPGGAGPRCGASRGWRSRGSGGSTSGGDARRCASAAALLRVWCDRLDDTAAEKAASASIPRSAQIAWCRLPSCSRATTHAMIGCQRSRPCPTAMQQDELAPMYGVPGSRMSGGAAQARTGSEHIVARPALRGGGGSRRPDGAARGRR